MNDKKRMIEEFYKGHLRFIDLWQDGMFLTWRWYLVLAMTVIPWIVWLVLRKKDSTHRLMYAGLFVAFMAVTLDIMGVVYDVWSYPVLLFPILPECSPFNLTVLPVVSMLFLQYRPKTAPVLKALVYAALGSFVYQPLMRWAGLYAPDEWKDWYSFPLLFLIYLAADWLSRRTRFAPL